MKFCVCCEETLGQRRINISKGYKKCRKAFERRRNASVEATIPKLIEGACKKRKVSIFWRVNWQI